MTELTYGSNRRRRLTIAALVLLALGGGLWWSMRPKIDPRLVGKWYGVGDDDTSCNISFYPGRTCNLSFSGPSYRYNTTYEWCTQGSRLILFPRRPASAVQTLSNWLSLAGIGSSRSSVYRLAEFADASITLEADKLGFVSPKTIKLTRIPD